MRRFETIRKAQKILRDESSIERVGKVSTMQLGSEQVLLTGDVGFQRELDVEHLDQAIHNIETRIRSEEPGTGRIFFQPDPLNRRRRSA